MGFEDLNNSATLLKEQTKELIENNISYYKLLGFKITVKTISLLVAVFMFLFLFFMALIFSSIALSLYISMSFENNYIVGFSIVSGIYLLLSIFLLIFKINIIDNFILKIVSKYFFNNIQDEK